MATTSSGQLTSGQPWTNEPLGRIVFRPTVSETYGVQRLRCLPVRGQPNADWFGMGSVRNLRCAGGPRVVALAGPSSKTTVLAPQVMPWLRCDCPALPGTRRVRFARTAGGGT